MTQRTRRCPSCKHAPLEHARHWPSVAGGALLVLLGLLGTIPTFGLTLAFSLWGVFLMQRQARCPACGWRERR